MTPPDPRNLDQLAADWIALCESEVVGALADRELAEAWARLLAPWDGLPRHEHDAPRPAAPAAASEPRDDACAARDDEAAALRARIGELERRLDALEASRGAEHRAGHSPGPRRRPTRA